MRRTSRSALRRAVTGRVFRRAARRVLLPGQRARRSQFEAAGVPADRIVLLGDSISEQGAWDVWLPGLPVLNRGIGGETSAQVLTRLDTAIDRPRAVLLLIGTNDLTAAIPVPRIAAAVRRILDGIEQRAPGVPIVLQSVMPRALDYRDEVLALNERLRPLAEGRGDSVRWLDLWPALATPEGELRPELTWDRLHLNGAGYRAWAGVLRPLVDRP